MMADEIASLILKVESSGITKATSALDNLTKSGLRAEDAAGAMSDAWGGLGKSVQTATDYQDRYVQSVNRYLRQEREVQKQTRLTSEEWNKQNDALQELIGQINPLIGAFGRLDEAEKKLQGFHKSGVLDAEGYKEYTAQINKMRVDLEAAAHARTEEGKAEARAARESAAVEKAATLAKQSFIDKLKTESETLGLTSHQMLEYKAAQLGVTKEAQPYIAKLKAAEAATESLGLKSAMARRELGVLIGELARGNFGQLRGSGITLANRAGWIDKLFTLRGLGTAGLIGGIGAAVYALGKAWYEGSQEAVEFNKQLILTGGYAGKTAGQLQDMARALSGNGVTQHDAAGVLAQVVGSGAFSGSDVNMVARTAARMKEVVGQSVEETINQFKRLQQDPVNASKELDNSIHHLTATQLEQIRVLGEQGRTADAAKIAMSGYADEMNTRMTDVHNNLGWIESAWNSLGDAAKWAWDQMLDIGREDSLDEKIAKLQEKIKNGGQQIGKAFIPVTQQDRDNLAALQEEKFQKNLKDAKDKAERNYQETQKRRNKENHELDLMNETEAMRHAREIERINAKQYADASKRNGAIERENERHKKAMERQTKKPGAYHDDEATRLLMQYREKGAKLQGEINNASLYSNQKLTESEKELLALETRIAGMKDKTLTAADKSILEHQKELEEALRINAEKEKELQHQEALNRLQAKSVQLAKQHRQQLEQLRAKGEFDVASLGMGNKQRQRAQEEFNLKQQFANEQEELDRSARKDGTYGSTEYFAQAAENAAALNEQLAQIKDNYVNIDKAQGDWHAGAERAFQNFTENAMNVAGTTEQAFNLTFSSMTNGLETFVTTGKMNFRSFVAELLAGLAKIMAQMAVMQAATGIGKWLGFIGGAAGGAASGMGSGTAIQTAAANWSPFAKGGAISSPDLSMYSGQILTQPTFFKFARGGVAGEAGPEAILPLARDSRGYMGVRLADKGGKQQPPPIQITVTQHIDQRGTDQKDQAAAQRNNQQLARMVSDLVDTKVNRALNNAMRDGGKLAGVR
ncbi:phage tail tape measure protein [Salmonella enterica subsp. enterica serovar Champaign]|nr:phage tail tape measure protein [Salmonella enterica subsp. enterica serovar Champaign]